MGELRRTVWKRKKAAELMKILDILTLLIKPRLRRSVVLFLSTLIPFAPVVCLSVRPTRRSPEVGMRGRKAESGWAGEFEERRTAGKHQSGFRSP